MGSTHRHILLNLRGYRRFYHCFLCDQAILIDARNAIKEQLSVTQENSWINPRTGEREHLARRYLNFSEAEWAAMHALTEDGRQQRLEGQQLLDDPDAIVARGAELLGSQRWEDV